MDPCSPAPHENDDATAPLLEGEDAAPASEAQTGPETVGQTDPEAETRQDEPELTLPSEDEQRARLGLEPAGAVLPAAVRHNGWLATALVTVVAALTRFIGAGHPSTLMFDEIYYVKDAYALWHNGYESSWKDGADALFARGDFSALTTEPSFVVHPQLGKWLIGLGGHLLGWDSPAAWRFVPAVAGVLTVLLLSRLTMRLTRSPLLAGLAGLLLAVDGVGITESRIGLLDVLIGLFATLSVYCLVRDRQWLRERLAHHAALPQGTRAPRTWLRPWLLATGISLGLTCSIKWSGLYLIAAVGILVVVWDTTALSTARGRARAALQLPARAASDFLHLVPVALGVYLAGWFSWFTHPQAYKHGWAAGLREAGKAVPRGWLPDSLNDLIEYHLSMYSFHVTLDSTHPYMSQPVGWLLQLRPTSFYWPSEEEMAGAQCGSSHCVQAITSIGNIPVWWSALAALVVVILVIAIRNRDWRAWVALIGYVGLYLPWFNYAHEGVPWPNDTNRTIFTFYTVAFVPFVVLALVLTLGLATGMLAPLPGSREARLDTSQDARRESLRDYLGLGTSRSQVSLRESWTGVPARRLRSEGLCLTGAVVTAALLFAVLWWPIWTGQTVSYSFWHWHMLLPSWI